MVLNLTTREISFTYSLVNDLYQNWNFRSIEGALLQSILTKLNQPGSDFSETEVSRLQVLMRDRAEVYSRIADPRLQFILQADRGVIKEQNHGFDGPATFRLCKSILSKIEG